MLVLFIDGPLKGQYREAKEPRAEFIRWNDNQVLEEDKLSESPFEVITYVRAPEWHTTEGFAIFKMESK